MPKTNAPRDRIIADAQGWIERNIALLRRPDGKFIRATEIRLARKVKKVFDRQMQYVIDAAKDLSAFRNNALQTNAMEDEVNEVLRKMPGQRAMSEAIIVAMKLAMLKGAAHVIRELKLGTLGISFDLGSAAAVGFLGHKLSHELSQKSGNINATTVNRIAEILKEAAKQGWSYQKTAQLIREAGDVGVFSRARAEMIAVREVGIAYEEGNAIPVREFRLKNPARLVLKSWRTVRDDKVTPAHRRNEADGWIMFETAFSGTGDMHAPASDHPRCRCATAYSIGSPP